MAESPIRGLVVVGACLLGFAVMGYWTLRAVAPEPPGPDEQADRHYLPIPGEELFVLRQSEADFDAYVVEAAIDCVDDAGAPATSLAHGEPLFCRSGESVARTRLRLEADGPRHLLLLDGFRLEISSQAADETLATVGLGRSNDVVLPLAGVGAEHIRFAGPGACDPGADDEPVLACVWNAGLRGSLIVDSTARITGEERTPVGGTTPILRRAPGRDEAVPVRDEDRIWVGQVPLAVKRRSVSGGVTVVDIRVPLAGDESVEGWRDLAGDRSWMGLELPSWPLARIVESDTGRKADGLTAFTFHSREELFQTWGVSPMPWSWDTHLENKRVEWQQEEQLQRLIDHELLCLHSDYDPHVERDPRDPFPIRLTWNLDAGRGCDGAAIPPPPKELFRHAGEWAHDRDTTRRLEHVAALLSGLPEETPNPAELGFVFDWQNVVETDDEMRVVPTRLLGVRPMSTQNGPQLEYAAPEIDDEDDCDLAESGWGRPPVRVKRGTSSPTLRVGEGTQMAGAQLLLASDEASICLDDTVPDYTHLYTGSASAVLGHLGLSKADRQWSATTPVAKQGTTCALLARTDAGWTVTREGPGEVTVVGDGLADLAVGQQHPLRHNDQLSIRDDGGVFVDLVLELPEDPDVVARTERRGDELVRTYPFGAALAGFLGVRGKVWGGIEDYWEPALLRAAEEEWEDSCDEPPADREGIQLTLNGDLQRLMFGEIERIQRERQQRVTPEYVEDPEAEALLDHEVVRIQAVLLDAKTGDVLAVVNAPSFNPNAEEELRALQDQLKRRDGRWQPPPHLENLAFRRNKNIGSVYKLATSYAMARSGLLDQGGTALSVGCWKQGFRSAEVDADQIVTAVPDDYTRAPSNRNVRCASAEDNTQSFVIGSPSAGFPSAFKFSKNPYFSFAALAMVPDSGIRFQLTPSSTVESPGIHTWTLGTRTVQDLIFKEDFDPGADLTRGNAFLDALVALGHRYHYGLRRKTHWVDEVNGTRFSAVDDRRWLPGVEVGGFWYPSMLGPELFTTGDPEKRALTLTTRRGADEKTYDEVFRTEHIANYAKAAYGMGGIESNALALAVLGTPMVAAGDVISPDLVVGASSEERRVLSEDFLTEDQRKDIETAMRSVVGQRGTAWNGGLRSTAWPGVGAKTGTFDTDARVRHRTSDSVQLALMEVEDYACGRVGSEFDRLDWLVVAQLTSTFKKQEYMHTVSERVSDGWVPPLGFAAGSETCARDNPNRAGVSADVGPPGTPIDGGVWLDVLRFYKPAPAPQTVLVPGSSLITVVFDGLVASPDGTLTGGEGWVLAVVSDGRDKDGAGGQTTAKRATIVVLPRLQQYLELQNAQGSP